MAKVFECAHATLLMNSLRDLHFDYSLLLFLTLPKSIVEAHACTAYMNRMYHQIVLEPFCQRLLKRMGEAATDEVSKSMLKYCEAQSSEFLRFPDACLAGLRTLCPEEALSQFDDVIKRKRVNFTKFFRAVSEDVQVYVPKIQPGKYLCAHTKKEAINKYSQCKSEWGQHNPCFFQTYDMAEDENGKPCVAKGTSVFVIFRNPGDAVRAVAEYLVTGRIGVPLPNGRIEFKKVMGVNELFLDGALCNFILDLETTLSFHGGRRTEEEIRASMDRFLGKLLGFYATEGILPDPAFVGVSIKNKSRPLPKGDFKVSIHAVPGIVGTKETHNAALRRFQDAVDPMTGRTHRQLIEAARDAATENGGSLPEGFPLCDLEFWDFSAGKSNGIATQFSRKREEDPYSVFDGTKIFANGEHLDWEPCLIPAPHDPLTLSKEQVRQILWQLLSSTPKYVTEDCYPIAYTEDFFATIKVFFLPPLGFEPMHP